MRYLHAFVQVRPKLELKQKVFELTESELIRGILTTDFVWGFESYFQPGVVFYLRRINPAVYEEKVRIMQITSLYFSWVLDIVNPDDEIVMVVKAILGNPPFKPELFDKWWTLHHLGQYESIQEYERDLPVEASDWIENFENDGVQSWWTEIFDKKK